MLHEVKYHLEGVQIELNLIEFVPYRKNKIPIKTFF